MIRLQFSLKTMMVTVYNLATSNSYHIAIEDHIIYNYNNTAILLIVFSDY